jgi:hypothetical protein
LGLIKTVTGEKLYCQVPTATICHTVPSINTREELTTQWDASARISAGLSAVLSAVFFSHSWDQLHCLECASMICHFEQQFYSNILSCGQSARSQFTVQRMKHCYINNKTNYTVLRFQAFVLLRWYIAYGGGNLPTFCNSLSIP